MDMDMELRDSMLCDYVGNYRILWDCGILFDYYAILWDYMILWDYVIVWNLILWNCRVL